MRPTQPDPTAFLKAAEALRIAMQRSPLHPRTAEMERALAAAPAPDAGRTRFSEGSGHSRSDDPAE